jgi:hypothetical protein
MTAPKSVLLPLTRTHAGSSGESSVENSASLADSRLRPEAGRDSVEGQGSSDSDSYLRTMVAQSAHLILGPFRADSDLRRWSLKLAERGGKNAKKTSGGGGRAEAGHTAHRLWVSGEAYEPHAFCLLVLFVRYATSVC